MYLCVRVCVQEREDIVRQINVHGTISAKHQFFYLTVTSLSTMSVSAQAYIPYMYKFLRDIIFAGNLSPMKAKSSSFFKRTTMYMELNG